MKKLILVDGYGFLFRAFFAIRNLTKSDGTPVGALYGFTRMLMKLITDKEYSNIAVVFDCGQKTFRHEMYSEYKANRPECPPELCPQFPLAREVVEALNISIMEKVGYEADDIIATYAKKAEKEGYEVIIVSSDKDLMQLVDSNIIMYDGMKQENIDTEKVKEKWGVMPVQVLDVLSLTGDSSDNVPGVPGIGPKTAAELINKYGTLEELYKNVTEIKQNRRRETLIENKENAFLSKRLITLDENVKLDISVEDLKSRPLDYKKLINFLKEQEFNSMAHGLEKVFSGITTNEEEIKAETNKNISEATDKEININELSEAIKQSTDAGQLYFEIVTENTNYKSKILGFAFGGIHDEKYFIEVEGDDGDLFATNSKKPLFKDILKYLKETFENESILKVGYDIKKQIKILYKYGIKLLNFEDIQVINYILHAGLYDSNLSTIIENNLKGDGWYSRQEYKQLSIEEKIEIIRGYEKKKLDTKNVFEVSCFIIETFKPLYRQFKQKLIDEELVSVYEKIEKPMTQILADIELIGVKIDIKKLEKLSSEFANHIADLEKQIHELAGEKFNIGSPKQLSDILFNKLKLNSKKKSSKGGIISTGSEILEELAEDGCDICRKVLLWRQYSKLNSTYVDVLPKMSDSENRVHTTYSNTYVSTGRLSSSDPNLQNIPIRTAEGSKIRTAFIAKEGCKLIGADYSQVELKIIANYYNVKKLKDFFLEGKDIHKKTASEVFEIPEEEVNHEMRSIAKAINFSILYGTTQFGLAKRINSTHENAKTYIDNYFKTYPEIKKYMQDTKKFVDENNYVKTIFGRICNINIKSAKPIMRGNLERLAINAPIQGSAADIIKMAMAKLDSELKKINSNAKVVMQIHDELVLECPNEEIGVVKELLKTTMENIVEFEVPLTVSLGVGDNWEEMK